MEDKKAIDRPDLSRIWASSGAAGVTSIDAEKYLLGWVAEIPTYQHMNFLHNRMDKIQLALAERGFHAWGTDIKYTLGSLVWNDKDSYVYVSKVENPTQAPSATSTHWVRSMCQLTVQEFLNIEKLIQTHEADKTNPHGVSAGQIGAYTKPETDTKISQLNTSLTSHANNKSNPHGVTAEQAGAIHTSRGGTYSGKVTFNHSETGFGSHNITNDGNGFNLKVGTKRLGLNTSGLPIYFDGTNNNNILFDTNFDDWRANTESEYSVPAPDVHIPFISDLNMIEGFGCVEYSRPTPATYIDKSGVLRTAAVDEPRFEKEGLLIEGQSTNIVPTSGYYSSWSTNNASNSTLSEVTFPSFPIEKFGKLTAVTSVNAARYIWLPTISGVSPGTVYTISVWVNIPSGSQISKIRIGSASFDSPQYTPVDVSTGMNRVSCTGVISAGRTAIQGYVWGYYPNGDGGGVAVVGQDLLSVGCIQIEAMPFATSYIPTNGAVATRAADLCSMAVSNNAPVNAPITIATEYNMLGGTIGDGQAGPSAWRSLCGFYTAGAGFYNWLLVRSDDRKLSYAWGREGARAAVNTNGTGLAVGVCDGVNFTVFNNGDKSQTVAALTNDKHNQNTFAFGNLGAGSGQGSIADRDLWGHIRNFRIWHKALTDKQISTLS